MSPEHRKEGSMQAYGERLFVRDEETGRFVFNAPALRTPGFDPEKVASHGYRVNRPRGTIPGSRQLTPSQSP
jgi:hypothetical protein